MSCVHCHTSSGRYRFVDNTNQACLPCHPRHVSDPAAHTHHTADGPAGRCVVCHMPVTEFARMRRSDHSMRPPMPAATLAFNSPNACNLCHTEQTAECADYHVRQWRTRDYQAATLCVAALIDAARKRDWPRLPEMLAYITGGERDEIFAVGLIRLLRTCADERKWPALVQALKDASPLVRASAAEGLAGYLTPESVSALVAAAGDEYRLVRIRAAASLAAVPPGKLPDKLRQDLERATGELLAVSRARRRGGDTEAAITTLRALTDRDVAFADAYTLLGQTYEEDRRIADATELYRRAAANPRYPRGLRQQFAARAARLSPG